jgi:excisionase family DNA binding protein
MKPANSLLGTKEMAARMGTTGSKLLRWYHEGKIPAEIAEVGHYRFDEDAVLKAMEYRKARLEEFYASRQAAVAAGTKPWNLPSSRDFREKMDAELIEGRIREAEKELAEKEIPIPSAPLPFNGYQPSRWVMVI